MPDDPIRAEDTRQWICKAAADLRAADVDLAASPPLVGDALFHCQQAVEKIFKALLTWHDRPFRKTHHLEAIGETCLAVDPTLERAVDEAVPLTEYAWKFRYPGEAEEPGREEGEQALDLARRVCEAVLARLPEELRP